MDQRRLAGILSGADRSMKAKMWRMGLAAVEPGYRAAVWLRNLAFDLGIRQAVDLGRPSVSVGNLTTGGTGKTPVTVDFVRRLQSMDRRPAVLLRGYGANEGASDETRELRDLVGPPVPVEPNPSRAQGALSVIEHVSSVDCFVLDDGFQHRQAQRDVDVVLVDATGPFGFERVLPRGLLREPVESLKRSDAVIVTRADQVVQDEIADLDRRIHELTGRPPLAHAAHRWTGLRHHQSIKPISDLASLCVVGVCGIGNPQQFSHMLHKKAGQVIRFQAHPDHYAYTTDEPRHILAQAKADGADAVVTTEKDWVKWSSLVKRRGPYTSGSLNLTDVDIPVLRPVLAIDWLDGSDAVDAMLGELPGPVF